MNLFSVFEAFLATKPYADWKATIEMMEEACDFHDINSDPYTEQLRFLQREEQKLLDKAELDAASVSNGRRLSRKVLHDFYKRRSADFTELQQMVKQIKAIFGDMGREVNREDNKHRQQTYALIKQRFGKDVANEITSYLLPDVSVIVMMKKEFMHELQDFCNEKKIHHQKTLLEIIRNKNDNDGYCVSFHYGLQLEEFGYPFDCLCLPKHLTTKKLELLRIHANHCKGYLLWQRKKGLDFRELEMEMHHILFHSKKNETFLQALKRIRARAGRM